MNNRKVKLNIFFAALVVLAGCGQKGKEWVCPEAGVSFRLPNPNEWYEVPLSHDEGKLGLHEIDGKSTIAFLAFKRKSEDELNEKFVTRWEKGMYKKGGLEKISGEFLTFKGRPAYKIFDKKTDDDGTRSVILMWFEKDYILEIAATTSDADPLQNSTVKEFIDSMKFLPASTNDVTISTNRP